MTVKEYNREFLPKIERAEEFINLFESAIRHMDKSVVNKDEVRRHFELRCYSEETKQTILTALNYYKEHEGLDKIEY
jgi:SOS response regulatory protein OraA/RecX